MIPLNIKSALFVPALCFIAGIYIVGKVIKIDDELTGYFRKWFFYGDDGTLTEADFQSWFCPYVIACHSFKGTSNMIIAGVMLSVLSLIVIAILVALYINEQKPKPVVYQDVPVGREFDPTENSFTPYENTTPQEKETGGIDKGDM